MKDFINNIKKGSAMFYVNLAKMKTIQFNGKPILVEEYNMLITKRDFGMYALGMIPYRGFKFNATKKYYGITGNGNTANTKLRELYDEFVNFKSAYISVQEKKAVLK